MQILIMMNQPHYIDLMNFLRNETVLYAKEEKNNFAEETRNTHLFIYFVQLEEIDYQLCFFFV